MQLRGAIGNSFSYNVIQAMLGEICNSLVMGEKENGKQKQTQLLEEDEKRKKLEQEATKKQNAYLEGDANIRHNYDCGVGEDAE